MAKARKHYPLRRLSGQCHRCQNYGHSARNCFARPRCVKCLGDHATADCGRRPNTPTPPSCTLCLTEGHTANYRGCSRAPRPAKKKATHTQGNRAPARAPAKAQTQPEPLVPAPLPANNAWIKPPAIVSKVAPNPPAQKAPPAQSAPPMPIHKPVPKTLPAAPKANGSSLAQDFAMVARLASTIDPNEIALLASKLRLYKESPQNRLAAVCEHIGVLTAILNFNL
ncbi:atherin-like [Achroia grisella]|uniref:atherin-like n=1 Tax=Achroia grisella TaxID=688607 RepID=UPI0027D2858E|nr:atherin-like [Achroia grisella]